MGEGEKRIRQEVSLHPRIKSPFSGIPGGSKGHPGVTLVLQATCSISLSVSFVPGWLPGCSSLDDCCHSTRCSPRITQTQTRDLGFDCSCPVPVEQ